MLDLPPSYCELKQELAVSVMAAVKAGNLDGVKSLYPSHHLDGQRRVLRKALDNYMQKEPLTPTEFGIKIYKECVSD